MGPDWNSSLKGPCPGGLRKSMKAYIMKAVANVLVQYADYRLFSSWNDSDGKEY